MVNVAIVYWSGTGNTEKCAKALKQGCEDAGADVFMSTPEEAENLDFFDYDLVCVGTPTYQWLPPEPMGEFLNSKFDYYKDQGRVKTGSPKIRGRNALILCTYSGPHTGKNEAIPAVKYTGQFFEHLGFTVLDEWYVLSEFCGSEEKSTKGRMGDIRGLPNDEDLEKIRKDAQELVRSLED